MPFNPATELPTSPLATVIFRGLLLLRPDAAGNVCEVGVHRRAADHYTTIAIVGRRPGGEDFVIDFLAGPPTGRTFSIGIDPPAGGGVYAYTPGETFDRNAADNDDHDLRWAIDLEGPEFHDGPLGTDAAGILPGIELSHGVFHTVLRTEADDVNVTRKGGSKPDSILRSIAHVIGAHLAPPEGSSLLVKWQECGLDRSLRLPRAEDPAGTSYEIYVRNDPPGFSAGPGHDELEQYYQVIRQGGTAVGAAARFTLEAIPVKAPFFTTDRIPCMPVVLGL